MESKTGCRERMGLARHLVRVFTVNATGSDGHPKKAQQLAKLSSRDRPAEALCVHVVGNVLKAVAHPAVDSDSTRKLLGDEAFWEP